MRSQGHMEPYIRHVLRLQVKQREALLAVLIQQSLQTVNALRNLDINHQEPPCVFPLFRARFLAPVSHLTDHRREPQNNDVVVPVSGIICNDHSLVELLQDLAGAESAVNACDGHMAGQPKPQDLQALYSKLAQKRNEVAAIVIGTGGLDDRNDSLEAQAEAAAASALAAADRIQWLETDTDSQNPDSSADDHRRMLGIPDQGMAPGNNNNNNNNNTLVSLDQRMKRLSQAYLQGLKAAAPRLLQLISRACAQNIISDLQFRQRAGGLQEQPAEPLTEIHCDVQVTPEQAIPSQRQQEEGSNQQPTYKPKECRRPACAELRSRLHCFEPLLNKACTEKAELQAKLNQCKSQLTVAEQDIETLTEALRAATTGRETAEAEKLAATQALKWAEADPYTLSAASAESLADLVTQLETRLSRARMALAQANTPQEHLCPVCWEQRKRMVFQCGHQTCETCGEKLTSCPICRTQVTIRIKTF